MIRVGEISHPDKIIDEKVKAFYDYFHYALSDKRDITAYSLENHLTIIDRLKKRLQSFSGHRSTVAIIRHYLSHHPLFNKNKDRITRKEKPQRLIKKIRGFLDSKEFGKSRQPLDELESFLDNELHKEADNYFLGILYNLLGVLTCEHPLSSHRDEIMYYSHLIAAEFLRIGFDSAELTSINGVFNRILSKHFVIDQDEGKNGFVQFPLPDEIERNRGTEDFESKVSAYLKGRTFREQFEGIHAIYSKKLSGDFLFRVDDVSLHGRKELNFGYDTVEFVTANNLGFDIDAWKEDDIEKIHNFTQKENSILAKIKLDYYSENKASEYAIYRIKNCLGAFNFTSGRGGRIFSNEYYIFRGAGARYHWKKERLKIINFSDEKEEVSYLSTPSSALTEDVRRFIFESDQILFRAYSTEFWDDEIVYFWRYLERVFHEVTDKSDRVISQAGKILFLSEQEYKMRNAYFSIFNILGNSDHEVLGFDSSLDVNRLVFRTEMSTIEEMRGVTNYHFVNFLFEEHDSANSGLAYSSFKYIYSQWFKELYEQRNIILHQGGFCMSTIEGLRRIMPTVMKRIRNSIVEFANSNPGISSSKKLMESITKSSNN